MPGFKHFMWPVSRAYLASHLQQAPRWALAPLPLFPLQPLLLMIVRRVAARHAEVFDRLGPHAVKRFLIDPVNLPFVFVLRPDRRFPTLRACRRHETGPYDARMAGTLLTLVDLLEGRLDSDALFFSRDLTVEGDTEAVVALRNALDDLDENVMGEVLASLGPLSSPARLFLGALRHLKEGRSQHAPPSASSQAQEDDHPSGEDFADDLDNTSPSRFARA